MYDVRLGRPQRFLLFADAFQPHSISSSNLINWDMKKEAALLLNKDNDETNKGLDGYVSISFNMQKEDLQ